MHCKKPLSAAIACVLFMLSGCDRTTESGNYRLQLSPSLGMIKNANVRVYDADGRTLMGKGTTGTVGSLGMYPGPARGPVVVSILGDADATYYDEYLLSDVSFPTGQSMHALLASPYGNYGVSPLTELAYRIAVDQGLFPLTANEVNILNERVRAAFAPELSSLVEPMTIIDSTALLDFLVNPMADTMANRYAVRLAALSILGSAESRPALTVMNALSNDILDGVIDGLDKNSNPLTIPYDPNTIVADMTANLNTVAGMYASPALASAVSGYAPMSLTIDLANIDDGSNFSGCVDDAVSTLPPGIIGETINMYFEAIDSASPFASGEATSFTFCKNGQLRIGSDYYVVSNTFATLIDPLDPVPVVYTWEQNRNGLVYEVVALDNVIYEVNLYGEKGALYFGRFLPY